MIKPIKAMSSALLAAGLLALASACNSTADSPSASSPPPSSAGATASVKPTASAVAATAKPTASATTTAPAAEVSKQLKELLELAKQGKAPGIEYAAGTGMIDEVEKAWGKPDTQDSAGSGQYATYNKKKVVFGFNKGSQIFDVRSSAANLQTLTLAQIEGALGKPTDTKVNGDDTIYIYKANEEFELKFIIPKSTGKVDHISVFAPKHAVNNMAN